MKRIIFLCAVLILSSVTLYAGGAKSASKTKKTVHLSTDNGNLYCGQLNGKNVYKGPKGGKYFYDKKGKKVYVSKNKMSLIQIVDQYLGLFNGKKVFEGPNGGKYYFNAQKKKTYLKKEHFNKIIKKW